MLMKAIRHEGTKTLGNFKINHYWQKFINTNLIKNLVSSKAFTMAEILLSLTIIGVVAAITLPTLTGNINERTWDTQRKALYARLSQAIALLPSMNGYGIGKTASETRKNAADAFINEGLAKVLKINNICDNAHLQDCGITSKYAEVKGTSKRTSFPLSLTELQNTLAGSWGASFTYDQFSYSLVNTNVAAFETLNGESIAVFYQPYCQNDPFKDKKKAITFVKMAQPFMCANFVYDLNGIKGPNQFGKDMGYITAFYPTDSSVVMPQPLAKDSPDEAGNYLFEISDALKICSKTNQNVITPSFEDISSVFINRKFSAIGTGDLYIIRDGGVISSSTIMAYYGLPYNDIKVRCIKK